MCVEKKKQDKRERIFNAALDLISKKGFHRTTTQLISKKANVGMGTLYRYFSSKEKLIIELYRHLYVLKNTIMSENLLGKSYEEQFISSANCLFHFYLKHQNIFLYLEQFRYSPYSAGMPQEELNSPSHKKFSDFLIKGIQNKKIIKMPLDQLMALIHGPIVSLIRQFKSKQQKLSDETITIFLQSVWNSIKI